MESTNLVGTKLVTPDLPKTSNFWVQKLNKAIPKLILISLQY